MLKTRQNYRGGAGQSCDPGVGRAVTHLCLLTTSAPLSRRRPGFPERQAGRKLHRRHAQDRLLSAREILRGAPQDQGKDGAREQALSPPLRSPYGLTRRIKSAQRSSTGSVLSAVSGGRVTTTGAAPMSR